MTSIWNKIGSLTPTRDAAVAMSGGAGYQPAILSAQPHWKAPPPTGPVPDPYVDRSGLSNGFLTVIGWHPKQPGDGKNAPARWVVRCVCGDYELRRHEKIRNGLTEGDRCVECRHVQLLRERAAKPSTKKTRAQSAARLDDMASKMRGTA